MNKPLLSKSTISRLPNYLNYLLTLNEDDYFSTQELSKYLNINNEVVKKDFQLISKSKGIPNKGRKVKEVLNDLKLILGYNEDKRAIIVGCGHLGKALLNYDGFKNFNLNIVAAFDVDKTLIGKDINSIRIYHLDDLVDIKRKLDVSIGIICVSKDSAQYVALKLAACGIEAIWNFSPIKLELNENIIVSNMDMAISLADLAYKYYLKKNNS